MSHYGFRGGGRPTTQSRLLSPRGRREAGPALKGLVGRRPQDIAPPIHNLVRLAEVAGVELTREQVDLLADVNAFNIEARYPDHLAPPPSGEEARGYLARIEEAMKWLMTL